jgi:tripartite-type tricarboxylate transporter receptor subunit TctC
MTNKPKRGILPLAAAAGLLLQAPWPAMAAGDYPNRTIKMVVPAPPGTNLDTLPRIIAEKLAQRWGQTVIIENKPGAAQNLGAEFVARSDPDGYTLLATPQGPLVISQSFFPKLRFDPAAFTPISVFAQQPLLLAANPRVPYSTLPELIAYAKANPGKINFASPGIGSAPHLTGEMLQLGAGVRFTHVPYKGMTPLTVDLLGGQVDIVFNNLGNTLPLARDGKVKVLAVANQQRIAELPDVPAIAELYSDFYSTSWFAFVAPPHTSPDIAAKLSQAIAETVRMPDVVERYQRVGTTPLGLSPADTAAFLKTETERWRKVIVARHIGPT